MNKHLLEKVNIQSAFVPINMASGANNGDWVSMKHYGRCAIVLFKGVGTAGEDPAIALFQATEVAGTTSKSLSFTRIDHKLGSLTSFGVFTTVTQAAAGSYTHTDAGENEAIMVIDVKAEDLDRANGYDCLRVTIADVGTTSQIGGGLYILHDPRYESATLPSPIID